MRPFVVLAGVILLAQFFWYESLPAQVATRELLLSLSADRSSPVSLEGQSLDGKMYVFVSPDSGILQVNFFLDDLAMVGAPFKLEPNAPFDFAGTEDDGTAIPFDSTLLSLGTHTITARLDLSDSSTVVLNSSFTTLPAPPDQIHLAWVDDPATSLTVLWRTRDATAPATVEYRAVGEASWLTATGAVRSSGTTGALHEAALTSLTPSTSYEYRVSGDAGLWSPVFTARTAPPAGPADFEAIYVADTGIIGRRDRLTTGTAQVIDEIAKLNPLLVLPGGDYAYFNTDDERFSTLDTAIDAWFKQMEPISTQAPLMPTYGNHEILLGEGFDPWKARFPTPVGFDQDRNFSFDVGEVHFVSIFAVRNFNGLDDATLAWIEQDITDALAAGQRWVIPYFHVSPFADGQNHPSNLALRGQLGPLFERLGVKLVLSSHDQAYERTFPLTDVPATNTPTSRAKSCYTLGDGVTWVKISPGGKLSNKNNNFSQFATVPPPEWTAVRDNTLHNFARLIASSTGDISLETYGVVGDGTPPILLDSFRYTLASCPPELAFAVQELSFTADLDGSSSAQTVDLNTSDDTVTSYTVTGGAGWLTVSTGSGMTPDTLAVSVDASGLAAGTHTATVMAEALGYVSDSFNVTLNVLDVSSVFDLLLSTASDRSAPLPLEGANVNGDIYVFTSPDAGVSQVEFWLDDPGRTGSPRKRERRAPYDFAGTAGGGTARPFDTTSLPDGAHTITAEIALTAGGTAVVNSTFTVANSGPGLAFAAAELSFTADEGGIAPDQTVGLDTNDGSVASYTVTETAPWLTVSPASGTTPDTLTVSVDTTGLTVGTHVVTVTAEAAGLASNTLTVVLTISGDLDLLVSSSPDRSAPVPLVGSSVTGNIYVFIGPDTGTSQVRFWLDDPGMTGSPRQTERNAPYDFAGTAGGGTARPFDTTSIPDGTHTITAAVDLSGGGGTVLLNSNFTVANTGPGLVFGAGGLSFTVDEGGTAPAQTVGLDTNDATVASYANSDDAAWLTVSPTSGTTPDTLTVSVDASGLAPGTYTSTVTASATGLASGLLTVTLTVNGMTTFDLLVSGAPDRSAPFSLAGATAAGDNFVFIGPDTGISQVRFWLDDPAMSASPRQTERLAPYDFAGTAGDGTARPFDTASVPDGSHTITAAIDLSGGGAEVVSSTFNVANGGGTPGTPALAFGSSSLSFATPEGGSAPAQTVALDTNDATVASYAISDDAAWLTVSPVSGSTPVTLTVSVDATGLAAGIYNATVTATATGYNPGTLVVTLNVGSASDCGLLPCSQILISLPYELDYDHRIDHGGIVDGLGVGTGFTYLVPTTSGTGYIPGNLQVNFDAGTFDIATTSGLWSRGLNAQDNALGVGIDAPSQVTRITATLLNPPPGTGNFEQAGLWFGNDEDNFIKLVVLSTADGTQIRAALEVNGSVSRQFGTAILDLTGVEVTFSLRANPSNREVTAFYTLDAGPEVELGTFTPPGEFFSFDAAGINPLIGTRTFTGIFASHRKSATPLVYTFGSFTVAEDGAVGQPVDESGFVRSSFPVAFPTSMVWGPDDRLYVLELFGTIHAFTLDDDKRPVAEEIITALTDSLGSRLSLGITVDSLSTAGNVILWVSHSSPSLNDGIPNSGMITRLSGPGFATVEHVITGLPRAKANHATNSIHFGPDGKLYIAQGGNTGAGAPNLDATEFGTMEEQPLSAAILVADVHAPAFDGSCNNPDDIFGPPPCDVVTYATGLRNAYDFVWHSNGVVYAPDNGLGVSGTFPPSPTPPCFGFGDTALWTAGGNNPGSQPDILLRVEQGKYYGHPNPYRDECVFKDGSFQGVAALPNFVPPLHNLGNSRSADGTIEYLFDTFFGKLKGEILIANFSVGDDISRIRLSGDGLTVTSALTLATGFNDPLPLALGPDGTIYVGEFGGGAVTALDPRFGRWYTGQTMPTTRLEVVAAAVGDKLYAIGGKFGGNAVEEYDTTADTWRAMANLPEELDHVGLTVVNSKIYVFGGLELADGRPVSTDVYEFDPAVGLQGAWTKISDMPQPVSSMAVGVHQGLIYVAGGMIDDHVTSLQANNFWRFDPATRVWTQLPDLPTYRDHLGGQFIGGKFYVAAGRQDGQLFGRLGTLEVYDPATNLWTSAADMPTPRRGVATVVLDGKLVVIGGEKNPDVSTLVFKEVEAYDPATDSWTNLASLPTPRHGLGAVSINGRLYAVGGGTVGGGSAPTNVLEILTFGNPR